MRTLLTVVVAVGVQGCAGDEGASEPAAVVRFDPEGEPPLAVGAVPFPK